MTLFIMIIISLIPAGRRDTPRKTLISIIISFAVLSMGNTWIISIQTDIISCADQKVRRRQQGMGCARF